MEIESTTKSRSENEKQEKKKTEEGKRKWK
jgi:hypothetical protein